jgi:predicted O-linked N-acetylglucosamine transferase (SPINDLY family)
MSSELFQLVSATRLEEEAFWSDTLLGRSLGQPQHRQLVARISFANRQGLAVAYNAAIEAAPAKAVLVFCHDDLDLGPEPLAPQLEAALLRFDLVGVAGNQRHQSGQLAWCLDPRSGGWDHPYLSGALHHGAPGAAQLSVYGPVPMPVQSLDGVFLAARADTLWRSSLRFDPRFGFHYYDLDFCRSARRAGLSLGTWPLPLLHAKGRDASGLAWSAMQRAYLRKWGEEREGSEESAGSDGNGESEGIAGSDGNEESESGEGSDAITPAAGASSSRPPAFSPPVYSPTASSSPTPSSSPTEFSPPAFSAPSELQQLFRSARALEKAGAWPEAERRYRQLLEQAPGHGATRLQLAKVLHQQGRDGEALALLNSLLAGASRPPADDLPVAADALGDSFSDATKRLRARGHANRGILLQLQGDLDAAQRDHGEALRLEPGLRTAADNLLALALLLRSQGRSHQALEALRMILRATPQRPDLLLQLGITLMDLGRVEAAVPCFRRLLRQEPQLREGHYQLGQALAALGQIEAGIAALNAALALDPDATEALVQLEMHRLSLCDWDDHERRMARLLAKLEAHGQAGAGVVDSVLVPPLSLSLFPAPPALHRRLGERWAEPTSRGMAPLRLPQPPPHRAGERWRIGYLSADFRNHAMGNLLHGLFARHDRRRFEVFAYSLADISDEITELIRRGVDHYVIVAGDSSEVIANRIRSDGIDVLIDLMGHTHHGRPGVLALRPAPLQLHYLGYPGSLGADWIDGVIADAWLIPPDHEIHYRETVHRLPWGFVSSGPLDSTPPTPPPPPSHGALGLPADAVVYACFNRPEKITPAVFDGWLEILRQVPDSVLWIINDEPLVEQRLRARLAQAGLEWRRLVFSPKVESAAFGQCCGLADLLLDTSPYGSGATAVTALAAGLPLLTCPGDTFASRMGASLCAATCLEELICPTPEAYRQRAIALGRQPAELQRLRHQLLEGRAELPLFNTSAWVGHLEQLLERLLDAGG